MASNLIFWNNTTRFADSASASNEGFMSADQSAGFATSFAQRVTVTLPPASGAIDIFPTGIPAGLANGSLEVVANPIYDAGSLLADRFVSFVVDTFAVDLRSQGGFGCDTSLTVANADATYSVCLELLFFVRTA